MSSEYIDHLIQEQVRFADFRATSYIQSVDGQLLPKRTLYTKIHSLWSDFYEGGDLTQRWLTISGVRGVGKTTLLFQLYHAIRHNSHIDTLFISLDYSYPQFGMSIADILHAYERVHKISFSSLIRPLYVCIDETQLDPNWIETLDALYKSNDKIFIIAVGTPVIASQNLKEATPNTKFEILHPMSSTEYLKIKKQKHKIPGLSGAIRDAILHSPDSDSLYASLQIIAPEVNTYYRGAILGDFYTYLLYGSLPQMLYSENESYSFEYIQRSIDRIIAKDLTPAKFHPDTVALIPKILRELTENDICNIKKLSEYFDLSRLKMSEILDILESSGLLRRIYPHGAYFQDVVSRKPSKYLFSTPAFRLPWYRIFADVLKNENTKSKIVQDIVAMYLYRAFDRNKKGVLTYDADVGGADFIINIDDFSIPVHIEKGGHGARAVHQTMQKYPSKYGIVISDNQLAHDTTSGIVKIPLRMFLLM